MASSSVLALAYTLCSLLCICSLQTEVLAIEPAASVNLTYYLQEIRGGPGTNGTLFAAAGTNDSLLVGWGTIFIFDSPLHEGLTPNTTLLGKSSGSAMLTNKGGIPDGGVQIYCQHIFNNASMYYKSSITVIGQADFPTGTPPWELVHCARGHWLLQGIQGLWPCRAHDSSGGCHNCVQVEHFSYQIEPSWVDFEDLDLRVINIGECLCVLTAPDLRLG